MEPHSSSPDQALLEEVRRRRGELRESMIALEDALSAPATADHARWVERVHVALVELSGDLRHHVGLTEGPDGLYRDLLDAAPQVSASVARLSREHGLIGGQVERLLALVAAPDATDDADKVRTVGMALLGRLVQHRQRDSDVVFEAFEFDLGGET